VGRSGQGMACKHARCAPELHALGSGLRGLVAERQRDVQRARRARVQPERPLQARARRQLQRRRPRVDRAAAAEQQTWARPRRLFIARRACAGARGCQLQYLCLPITGS